MPRTPNAVAAIAVAALTVAAVATAVTLTAQSAAASPGHRAQTSTQTSMTQKPITQTFQAQATDQLSTGPNAYVVADSDVAGADVIGHDVLTCTATSTHSTCQVAFAEAGGLLYAHFVLRDTDRTLRGGVDGGTGAYRAARGTLHGVALSPSAVQITLDYIVGRA